jgi:hypothetical protein
LQPVPDTPGTSFPDLSIDLDIGGGNTINLPVNVSFDPQVGINIEVGDINLTFDGDNVDIDFPTDPGAQPDIPRLPDTPGFTIDDRDRIENIENIVNEGVDVDLSPVLDAIANLQQLAINRFDSIDEALECLEELIKLLPCPECSKEFPTQVVANLSFTLGDVVKYASTARPGSCFLLVEVDSSIPPEVRKYTTTTNPDEVEAAIGTYAYTYDVEGAAASTPDVTFSIINKLSSIIYLPDNRINGVRFTCKPGFILTVTDLGYVRVVPEIECTE